MAASENAALKNIAPFKRTPFKASENASIFLRPLPDASRLQHLLKRSTIGKVD